MRGAGREGEEALSSLEPGSGEDFGMSEGLRDLEDFDGSEQGSGHHIEEVTGDRIRHGRALSPDLELGAEPDAAVGAAVENKDIVLRNFGDQGLPLLSGHFLHDFVDSLPDRLGSRDTERGSEELASAEGDAFVFGLEIDFAGMRGSSALSGIDDFAAFDIDDGQGHGDASLVTFSEKEDFAEGYGKGGSAGLREVVDDAADQVTRVFESSEIDFALVPEVLVALSSELVHDAVKMLSFDHDKVLGPHEFSDQQVCHAGSELPLALKPGSVFEGADGNDGGDDIGRQRFDLERLGGEASAERSGGEGGGREAAKRQSWFSVSLRAIHVRTIALHGGKDNSRRLYSGTAGLKWRSCGSKLRT